MALSDFLKLVDDKLVEAYNFVAPDPVKARKPFLKAIDKARKQYEEGKQPRGDAKFWSANNNVVLITPNVAGKPVMINGKSSFTVPGERAGDAFKYLEASTNKGELDEALAAATSGDGAQPASAPKSKQKRNIDPAVQAEANRKRAETRARNKAAKA